MPYKLFVVVEKIFQIVDTAVNTSYFSFSCRAPCIASDNGGGRCKKSNKNGSFHFENELAFERVEVVTKMGIFTLSEE